LLAIISNSLRFQNLLQKGLWPLQIWTRTLVLLQAMGLVGLFWIIWVRSYAGRFFQWLLVLLLQLFLFVLDKSLMKLFLEDGHFLLLAWTRLLFEELMV
jgi:hypothetical protein